MFGWNEVAVFPMLLGVAIKATAVFGVAWLAVLSLRQRSAAVRHLAWTSAAAAVLALPLLSIWLPAVSLPAASTSVIFSSGSAPAPATASPSIAHPGVATYSRPSPLGLAPWRLNWRIWIMLLWALGAAVVLAQMFASYCAIWSARRAAPPSADRALCGALSHTLGIRRVVDVLETRSGSMPMTFGILRSFILMPSNAVEWSSDRRRVVLMHELAHVRRADVATHLLARTALALYWWNPLAWTAWRGFLKERERAADDLVLSAGARASDYAGHLLEVARGMQCPPSMKWAAVAMARPSQLEGRLRAILDSGLNRKSPSRWWALAAAVLTVGLVAPLAAVRAQESHTPELQTIFDLDGSMRTAAAQKNPRILEDAARAAQRLRKYDAAQTLLRAAADMRANISGQASVEYGVALLNLADLENKAQLTKAAEASYAQAAQVLGDRPEASRAYIYLGANAIGKEGNALSVEYFQHAGRIDPARAGLVQMWMAVVRQREHKIDEAQALYQSALALQENSPEAVTTRQLYAEFLRQQGRADEARELNERNKTLRKATSMPSGVYRIGGGVTAPSVLQKIEPIYSEEARAAQLTGTEVLTVEIGTDGLAHNAQVVQGLGLGLDENSIDAVSQWRFQPGAKDGQPVTVQATIEINWRLM